MTPRRPLSAQTVLQKMGVGTELAKYISFPNVKKSTAIVDECLALKEPLQVGDLKEDIYQRGVTELKPFSRMESLVIKDFRAYKGRHEFDLDADLVIIYGPNGLGKTSFFDAIDFVSTGGCGRFKGFPNGENEFRDSACHLDSNPEDTLVELMTANGEAKTTFTRNLSDWRYARVNGARKDRTGTLFALTGVSNNEFENRVETIQNLFRATHLFGQDFQTLTEDFGKTSELPMEIVSRMLAFQDYVRSEKKISEVLELFQQKMKQLAGDRRLKDERLDKIKLDLTKHQ
jgi:exonuclease SbcC